MPMKWQRGVNPYELNYFRILQLGPRAKPPQILHQARNLNRRIDAGQTVEAGGQPLDTQTVSDASTQLRDPEAVAEELLLVHAPAKAEPKTEEPGLKSRLEQWAAEAADDRPARLKHPGAVLWFAPPPGAQAVQMPPWDALELADAGAAEDLRGEIMFDA